MPGPQDPPRQAPSAPVIILIDPSSPAPKKRTLLGRRRFGRRAFILAFLAITTAVSAAFLTFALVSHTPSSPKLFSDAFDDYRDFPAGEWAIPLEGGTWRVKSGALRQESTDDDGHVAVNGEQGWSDYSVTATVTAESGANGVIARYASSYDYYSLVLSIGKVVLQKTIYGRTFSLAESPFTASKTQAYKLTLSAVGARLSGSIEGGPQLSALDGAISAGRIGLYSGGPASFDDVDVVRADGGGRVEQPTSPAASASPSSKATKVRRTVEVSSSDQLAAALATAQAGDVVVLADGAYTMTSMNRARGTSTSPIRVMAKNRGKAVVTAGRLEIVDSAYVTIEGLTWTNSNSLRILSSHHVRLTRNHFELTETGPLKWVVIGGSGSHHNRVDRNLFENKHELGNFITIDGSPTQQSQDDQIDHNYFRNTTYTTENGMEAIRIGWSGISRSSGRTIVEYNLFENCDGDAEIVSVKSSDNIVRYNTFRASRGVLSQRHGDGGSFYGNFFFGDGKPGEGGIRVYGSDHKIFNNYFQGLTGSGFEAALKLDGGDMDGDGPLDSKWRVHRAVVVNNTFVDNRSNIEVGADGGLAPVDVAIADNIVVGSKGDLFAEFGPNPSVKYRGNIAWPTGEAKVGLELSEREIRVADPLLRESGGVLRLTPGSPAVDAASNSHDYARLDIDGQRRIDVVDVGADELSDAGVVNRPLKAAEVGPDTP